MTQKILHTLQKLPPDARCIWGALLLTVLVHLFLAVSFAHTAGESQYTVGELPKVGRIVLNDKSNADFARWMKNHDPSVMTAPDKKYGYSQVITSEPDRSKVEDLPNLLQPVIPQKAVNNEAVGRLAAVDKSVLPPLTKALPAEQGKVYAAVINGEYSAKLHDIVLEKIKSRDRKSLPDLQKLPDTVFALAAPRLSGTEARMIPIQSSGNMLADKTAAESLRRFLRENSAKPYASGQAVFIWSKLSKQITEEQKK